jgi:D-glucosaminate-6-phosphate ammonia-lyase
MRNRRRFLRLLSAIPLVGAPIQERWTRAGPALAHRAGRDYFSELGVRPFINAAGTYTAMTASLMPPEVMDAINYASGQFVMLDELHDRVGERIATLLGCEAAMVTAGAASALTLGTAAVLAGDDEQKIEALPNLAGMKTDVLIQKSHRFGYDRAVRSCGVRLVEVETREELERAITDDTAMMLFFNDQNDAGQIRDREFVDLGKKHGIPTFNDAAADVPPVEALQKYTTMGFDLVTFSGGKGLRGPQSAGLLLGRRDLIAAARLNAPPNANAIGRGMKVNKEEMLGMLAAVERYLALDHDAERGELARRAEVIQRSASAVAGVHAEIYVPPIANHVPHIRISWNPRDRGMTPEDVEAALRDGDPSIRVRTEEDTLVVGVWMMRPGEEDVVARRLRQVLGDTA